MPNWCETNIMITGDSDTLAELDLIMRSEGYERPRETDEDGQPMRLVPMPEVLQGTRSPAPEGEFDPNGRWQALVDDPSNDYWTPVHYKSEKAAHEALVARAARAKAEAGYADWYNWSIDNWGTKWPMSVHGYTYDSGAIHISGETAWAPPSELLRTISERWPVTIRLSYAEPGMDFIGASVFEKGLEHDSSGSFLDHMPDNLDWDDPETWDTEQAVRAELIDHHERQAAIEAGLARL
jgi:hypothetical protein